MTSQIIDAFKMNGVDVRSILSGQAIADCPFCVDDEGEKKLFINITTGQWDCKRCCSSGNLYTFMDAIHAKLMDETSDDDYADLVSDRKGVSRSEIIKSGVCYLPSREAWLIPSSNGSGKIANLYHWRPGSAPIPTPTCAHHLAWADRIEPEGPIYVCEGPWDGMAWRGFLRAQKFPKPYSVVWCPGAGTFKPAWIKYLKGREVTLLFDNDNAGKQGMTRVLAQIAKAPVRDRPSAVSLIQWPKKYLPKGDIRDYCHKGFESSPTVSELLGMCSPAESTDLRPARRNSSILTWDNLLGEFRKGMWMCESYEKFLALSLAVIFSVRVPGDPIWSYGVGPPSSGKTMILETFYPNEYCVGVSRFTPKALVSGWKSREGEKDPSNVRDWDGKAVIVKDLTALLTTAESQQAEAFGTLRDIFDGHANHLYGHGENQEFTNISFSCIFGVTDIIHKVTMATLGERFYKNDCLDQSFDHLAQTLAAMRMYQNKNSRREQLQRAVLGFIDRDVHAVPSLDREQELQIASMARTVGILRVVPPRDSHGSTLYSTREECGGRCAIQFTKTAQCLTLVFGTDSVDEQCMDLVRKLCLDTTYGHTLSVAKLLIRHPEGLTTSQLASLVRINDNSVRRILENMVESGAVDRDSTANLSGNRGRRQGLWTLNEFFRDLWMTARLPRGEKKKSQVLL